MSRRGHASFAKWRVLAVAAGGQASRGMLLLQSGACWRWRVLASKPGHVAFCKAAGVGGAAGGQASRGMLLLRSGGC